ncbi:MAG: DUF4198 domain-containing protein [Gammaproteobacteria bacterium]|nr:DUF4198 domain-containing protein [Gammaproteobacteria bacterium]
MRFRLTTTARLALAAAGAMTGWAIPAAAHDFWIEPAAYTPAVGATVPLTLRVGENFSGTSQPYVRDWFIDFSVNSAAGRVAVTGFAGDDPAATIVLKSPGLVVIGYSSTRSFVNLEAERFNAYLRAEGLQRIEEQRRQRGESGSSGREYYSRCAKSLLRVGAGTPPGATTSLHDRPLGYALELVPQADPYLLVPGERLPLALLYRGKPLEGALVIAFTAETPTRRVELRTGRDGMVKLPLDRAGRWLVKAVHMIPMPAGDPVADWESFWASLTFEVLTPGRAAQAASRA